MCPYIRDKTAAPRHPIPTFRPMPSRAVIAGQKTTTRNRNDWAVGPKHYRKVHFPNMLLWKSDVGHMPFLENREDMQKAVLAFGKRNGFL